MNVSALNDIVVIGREVKVKKDLTEVAAFITGAAQLGSWISPVKSVEAKLHGVIEFRSEPGFEHRGTYTVFDSPDHFILLTDKFGEIDVHFKQVDANTIVNFKFSKLGDESYERIVSDAVTRFIAMVNYK